MKRGRNALNEELRLLLRTVDSANCWCFPKMLLSIYPKISSFPLCIRKAILSTLGPVELLACSKRIVTQDMTYRTRRSCSGIEWKLSSVHRENHSLASPLC